MLTPQKRFSLQATNKNLNIGEIMDTWTRQMGYPVINVRQEGDYYLLKQERFLINTETSEDVHVEDSEYG